jgi:hypothetical protein
VVGGRRPLLEARDVVEAQLRDLQQAGEVLVAQEQS